MNHKAIINPALLKWFRESNSLSADFIAGKLGQTPETLVSWENGDDFPSVAQLKKIANVYKTHITFFYLESAPDNYKPKVDFRNIQSYLDDALKYRLQMNVQEASNRRKKLIQLFESMGRDLPELPNLKISIRTDVQRAASIIREFLGDFSRPHFVERKSSAAYDYWRNIIESKGILVCQISPYLSLDVSIVRGFCINEKVFPVIVSNSKDSHNGRIFSLLHELVHVLIGGKSEIQVVDFRQPDVHYSEEEVFCNAVAGEILVPRSELREKLHLLSSGEAGIKEIATFFGVSQEVVMRRLLDSGRITKLEYEKYRKKSEQLIEELPQGAGFVKHEYKLLNWNGIEFTREVLSAYNDARIGATEASSLLGAKIDYFDKIEDVLLKKI